MDIRKIIQAKVENPSSLWDKVNPIDEVKGLSRRNLSEFLNEGKNLNSAALGHVLDACHLAIVDEQEAINWMKWLESLDKQTLLPLALLGHKVKHVAWEKASQSRPNVGGFANNAKWNREQARTHWLAENPEPQRPKLDWTLSQLRDLVLTGVKNTI